MMISAEIYAVGDELCYGRVYDTNSFWLADQVTKLGLMVNRITCVRDKIDDLSRALSEGLERGPRFIFITGGLGPTPDDRTIETISKLAVRKIVTRDEILQKMAERRGVPITELSPGLRVMARTIDGAECYPNPVGWAPVTIIAMGETILAALPGPPKEMQGCFTSYLSKRVADITGYRSLSQRVYCTMYESEISPLLEALAKSYDGTYFKPLVGEYKQDLGLPVEIIVFAESEIACKDKFTKVFEALRQEITSRGKGITDRPSQGPEGKTSA